MKEKIVAEIYKKLCEGFNSEFFTLSKLESEYEKYFLLITSEITNLFDKYNNFKNSKNIEESSQVVKIFKDEFIIDSYNKEYKYYTGHTDYTISNLKDLKKDKEQTYEKYEKEYNLKFDNNNFEIIISFNDFLQEYKKEHFDDANVNKILSFEKLFWNFFVRNFYSRNLNEVIINDAINTHLEKFKNQYLENDLLKIYEIVINQINDIEFSNFELCAINVGKRTYESGNSGWIINNFEVNNNKNVFKFSNSTKDESRLTGMFINLFLLQLNKKHLLKISITLKETEQTTFIIWKDFEKISLKNDCEIYISKHHGNESIIFDSKKEAIKFQEKVLEIKEGRNNNFSNRSF